MTMKMVMTARILLLFWGLFLTKSCKAVPISQQGQQRLDNRRLDHVSDVFGDSPLNFRPTSSSPHHFANGNEAAGIEDKNPSSGFPGAFMPSRTGWKWWRYHEMSDKEILDHLLNGQHYDKREKPPTTSETVPTVVNVSMVIGDLVKIDSSLQSKNGIMLQTWYDPRLVHETRTKVLPYLNAIHHLSNIWMPPEINSKGSSVESIQVYPNGTVISTSRIHVTFTCQGDIQRFPFDRVFCSTHFQSFSYAQEEIMFRWWPSVSASIFNRRENEVENEEKKEDTIIGPVLLLGVSVQDFWPSEDCTSTKIAKTIFASSGGRHEGNYSCLEVALEWRRDLSQYWSDLFLPDMVLVATSFLTFWLDWSSVPCRAILGMAVLLGYFSNQRWSLQNLLERELNRPFDPVNNEMTALDVWRAFSMAFIYLACAEFALVHFLGQRASKRSKVSQLQEMLEHQHQKMQHQLERIRFEAISKASAVSTPCQTAHQNKFEKTATLMRHHRSMHADFKRQHLALVLDPFNNANSASNPNYIDHHLHEEEPPIFVPHHSETLNSGGARQKCCVNLSMWIDRFCRFVFPIAYFVFVMCYFSSYSSSLK